MILKVKGIDTCESAELLRQKEIYAEMEIDSDDSFDLVGFRVFVAGKCVGEIIDINNYGSKDIISVKSNHSCMLPVVDNLIVETNDAEKYIVLDNDIFNKVVVYEN